MTCPGKRGDALSTHSPFKSSPGATALCVTSISLFQEGLGHQPHRFLQTSHWARQEQRTPVGHGRKFVAEGPTCVTQKGRGVYQHGRGGGGVPGQHGCPTDF